MLNQIKRLITLLALLALLSACGRTATPTQPPASPAPPQPTTTPFRLPTPWTPTETPTPAPTLPPAAPPVIPTSIVPVAPQESALQILWQSGGELVDFAVSGEVAYLLVGPRLVSVDLHDPAAPSLLWQSEMLPAVGRALALAGERLYLLTSGGEVQVWDVRQPNQLVLAATIPVPEGAYNLAAQEDQLFLAEWRCSTQPCVPYLLSFDLTDVAAPQMIAELPLEARTSELHPAGDWLYALTGQSLEVIDLTQPLTPTLASRVAGSGLTTAAFDLPRVYLPGSPGAVLDFTEPVSPQLISTANFLFPAPLALANGRLYGFDTAGEFGMCWSNLLQIDVTQPLTPTLITDTQTIPTLRCAGKVQADGDRLYVQDWDGLEVIDLSQPYTPTLLASLPAALDGAGPVGDLLYYEDHLLWGDARGPASLHALKLEGLEYSGPHAPRWVKQLVPHGQVLYAPLWEDGLGVITARDPANPRLVRTIPVEELRGQALGATRSGQYLYVSTGDSGLQVLSLADPFHPVRVGGYRLSSGGIWALRAPPLISGDRAYIVEQDNSGDTYLGRLRVLDLTDPAAPVSLGEYDLAQPFTDVSLAIGGETLYLGRSGCYNGPCDQDFLALDVSDSAHPTQRYALDLPDGAYDVQLDGDLAWIASGASGVWLLDVSESLPRTLARLDTPGFAQGITLAGERIFVGDGPGGVLELAKP